jgi:hypothetical protein
MCGSTSTLSTARPSIAASELTTDYGRSACRDSAPAAPPSARRSAPGTGDGPDDDFTTISVKVGESPAVLERRSAARRARARSRLLGDRKAVGMTVQAVRKALGAPDHTQSIAGQAIVYYMYAGNLVQLVVTGGVVSQVNSY